MHMCACTGMCVCLYGYVCMSVCVCMGGYVDVFAFVYGLCVYTCRGGCRIYKRGSNNINICVQDLTQLKPMGRMACLLC